MTGWWKVDPVCEVSNKDTMVIQLFIVQLCISFQYLIFERNQSFQEIVESDLVRKHDVGF